MPNWTDEQLRAIEARGTNVLLSAAAGSGKTTVLVERVLRLVAEDGIDVDRMLVVTFTRAAASDMRAKLSREMNARAAAGDARCREQLLRLDAASITTLHGFCADFLRGSFEAAGVDPAFRVLDEAVAKGIDLPKLYFACGRADHLYNGFLHFKAHAEEIGLDAAFDEIDGYRHEWRFWDLAIERALDYFDIRA